MEPDRKFPSGRHGPPLVVNVSWLPACGLIAAHLALTAYSDRGLWGAVLLGLVTVAAYLGCVVVHALAHIVCARFADVPLGDVRVYVFGETSEPRASSGHMRTEAILALAGPVASALLGAGALLWSTFAGDRTADVLRTLATMNLALAVINLLPVLPLDGGRLVASTGRTRARLAAFGGKLAGFLAVIGGGYLIVQGPDLVDETAFGSWLVLIGVFVFFGSSWKTSRGPVLPDVNGQTVGQWARPFAGRLDIRTTAPASGGPYAVADDGRLAGVLIEAHLREGERVSELMVPWTAEIGVPSDAPLVRALQLLSQDGTDVVVVLDAEGIVRGVLDEGAVRAQLSAGRT